MTLRTFSLLTLALATTLPLRAETPDDPLAPWRTGVNIHPVAPDQQRHSMHSYFTPCPESPDGKWVLFFTSTAADGQHGDVRIRNRSTGEERVLVKDLDVEDAHRVACQQWVSGGKRVVYHGERNGEWFVGCVDLDTGKERELAHGQLAGWGQPNADIVPLYGPHWHPGDHRDLELINVVTGERQTPVTVDGVKQAYPDWFAKAFGDKQPSIFFPILSPDLQRVFFKMALATGEDPRSKQASARQGIICYSLAEKKFLFLNPNWGHPSWQPDSRHITEMHYTVPRQRRRSCHATRRRSQRKASRAAAATGEKSALAGSFQDVRGDHPSVSPDGRIVVTDTTLDKFGGKSTDWGVVLADAHGKGQIIIHKFDNSHGAQSWRVSHPHPVFSPDGKRIYFNISSGQWTQLYVAERQ